MNTIKILSITAILLSFFTANSANADATTSPIIWPNIVAASAIVYDPISNDVIYAKDADTVRPLASLSKLMTAAIVDELMNSNPNLANRLITIKETKNENESDFKLTAGTKWLPHDLIKFMLIGSSNKAAENLASQIIPRSSFISLMNHRARSWGLTDTYFTNPSGLPTTLKTTVKGKVVLTDIPSSNSTARQAANLLWKILENHNSLLDITREEIGVFASPSDIIKLQNTDKLINSTSTLNIIAGKTGFSDLAGGNLAVVIQSPEVGAHAQVIVVLGSTLADRFTDVEVLAKTAVKK